MGWKIIDRPNQIAIRIGCCASVDNGELIANLSAETKRANHQHESDQQCSRDPDRSARNACSLHEDNEQGHDDLPTDPTCRSAPFSFLVQIADERGVYATPFENTQQ
jgi:hypothetical protein